ncbi:MAG: nodulation protein NfeD [bacterium]|nr:nodulation protein NfeD [bacterium]
MRHLATVALGVLLLSNVASAEPTTVRFVEFETTVNPISAKRILRAIDAAEQAGDALVLIRLDTPGGLVVSMEKIVKRMLSAEVPVAVWVGPPGAHAASAGFFILIAADVAIMAPGTRTGAAATVFGSGEGNTEDNVLLKKANEDAAALLRSIAKRRNRNVEASEKAVFSATAYEESVALEEGLIDFVAADIDAVLETLDQRTVELFDGTEVVLDTKDATVVGSELSARQRFLELLGSPTVAYLLLLGGLLGLYVEITNPGVILPGVVGALCLILFAFSAQALPISWVALLLIALAIVMFVLEVKVASYGMLTIGGLFCLVAGSAMLVDGPIPELKVPWPVILPTSLVLAAVCVFAVRLALKAQRAKVRTGREGLIDEIASVTRELAPEGKVFVDGELWNAVAPNGPIARGARVRVVHVDGMTLTVEPAEPHALKESRDD